MKHPKLVALPIVLGVFSAALLMAQVMTAPPLSGNFAFTTTGFELVTPAGSNSLRLDISGEGLISADGNGDLVGSEAFTATNPAVPESGPVSAQCGGTVAGTVKEPGDGTAQIQLQFTPSAAPSPASGAQTACIPMAMTLSCVEVIPDSYLPYLVSPLAPSAGNAGCPNPTPSPTPHHKKKRHHRDTEDSVTPVDGGGFGSGANRLKCVPTTVVSGSTAASIDGASLSLSMQQTAPASITPPTPQPEPSAIPGGCSDPTQTNCGNICTDLTSDPNNCGACGVVCASGTVCASGACVSGTQCANGGANCNGTCTDLTSDANNCGACGVSCGNAMTCQSGTCVPVKPTS